MTELTILTILVVLASGVSLTLIPFLARRTAVYGIHGSRETLYAIGEAEGVRGTTFYGDLELLFNLALHVVREGTWWEAAALFGALSRPPVKAPSPRTRRSVEAFAVALGPARAGQAFALLDHAVTQVMVALLWRLLWASPVGWLVAVPGVVVLVVSAFVQAVRLAWRRVPTELPAIDSIVQPAVVRPRPEKRPRESILYQILTKRGELPLRVEGARDFSRSHGDLAQLAA